MNNEPDPQANSRDSYPVSFSTFWSQEGLSGTKANSLRLTGKGEIAFGSAGVIVRGKMGGFLGFGGSDETTFDPNRIFNVQQDGRAVRFEIQPPPGASGKADFLKVYAKDQEAAAAITARLPQTCTEEFSKSRNDLAEFRARLDRVTPHAPYVTYALVAINVVVFALMVWDGAGFSQPDGQVHIRWGSNFGPLTTDGQWWRLFTCMFLHFGFIHLLLNMAALYDSGRVIEKLFGHARYFSLYIFAGLAGSIASLLWNPQVNSAGASGAIFGIFGGLLAFMMSPQNRVPLSVMKQQRATTLIFIAYSLFNGLTHAGIDNAAHIGGLAGGFAMGLLLARPLDAELRAAQGSRRFIIAAALGAVVLALTTLPIKDVSGTFKKEQQYRQDLTWFAGEEEQIIKATKQWQEMSRSGLRTDAQIADQLEREVVARWEAAYRRLSSNVLDDRSRAYGHQKLLLDYIANRAEVFNLLLQAIRTNDRSKAGEANAKFEVGNKLLQELRQWKPQK